MSEKRGLFGRLRRHEPANPTYIEPVSFIGEPGNQFIRDLGAVIIGKEDISSLGPAVDRASDGTLRVIVDQETHDALEIGQ